MVALFMDGVVQAFADDRPLQCEIDVVVEACAFIRCPAHRAMIDDDVAVTRTCDGIAFMSAFVAQAESQESHNDVVRVDDEGLIAEAYTVARRGLTGDCHVALPNDQGPGECDGAGYFEYDRAGAPCLDG